MASRPQPPSLFVVEGRIGGRWWVWQRFRARDEAVRELASLAAEKRFDGARLVLAVPGGAGVSSTSRELVVVDERGVHGPGRGPDAAPEPVFAPPPRFEPPQRAAHLADPMPRRPAAPPKAGASARRIERRRDPVPVAPTAVFEAPDGGVRIEPVVAGPPDDDSAGFAGPPGAAPARNMARGVKRRQFVYTLGAGLASLLLALVSYEITRSTIGLPDLLYEARQAAGALFAGPERPIVTAARQGNTEEMAKLLRGGFSPNSEDPYGVPALLIAARAGKAGVVRQLLEAGADPNRAFRRGDTPLLAAAREGLGGSIELMLAKGGHVNGRGGADFCETPLLVAAAAGRVDTVNFLLAKGASFDVLPGCRKGPLDAAAAYPRVRDTLEQAFQRRLASANRQGPSSPAVTPAAAGAPAMQRPAEKPPLPARAPERPVPPLSAPVPSPQAAAPAGPQPAAAVLPDKAALVAAYRPIMFGLNWSDSLAAIRAKAKTCRDVGKRYVACELAVKRWLDDIETVEAWFDRSDGERFVAIEARSGTIVDVSPKLDGLNARQRFDKVRTAIEQKVPQGPRPIVARQAPVGIPFFAGLKPDVNAGDFSVFWSDEGKRRPAAIHLKMTGVDDQSGYYRIVVSNPLRYSQQASVDRPKP